MSERDVNYWKSRRAGRASWLAVALAGAAVSACSGADQAPATDTVRLRLDFGSGVMLSSVDYQLTGPGGFRQIGALSVGDQPSVTATFQNLPPGQGYDIQVRGTANDNASGCKGELMFNVAASMTAMLQIPLTCTGLAAVSTVLDVCPVIDSFSAIPSEVYVGSSIQVTALVHDGDNGPMPLSATWQTNGGALSNLSTTGATFTCTAPGTFTVGLRISDGVSADNCPDKATLTLVCTPAPSAALTRARVARRSEV